MATIVELSFTDEQAILEAFTFLAEKQLTCNIIDDSMDSNFQFIVDKKGDTEGAKAFGKRFIVDIVKAYVKAYQKGKNEIEYRALVKAVPKEELSDTTIIE